MEDLIKRSDAIKIMACEMYAEAQSQGYEVDSIEDFIPEAKSWMNDAPSADRPQGEWIPCSERLPSESDYYLVTLRNAFDDIGICVIWFAYEDDYSEGSEWREITDDDTVLAWMPLPEPWKGAEDED